MSQKTVLSKLMTLLVAVYSCNLVFANSIMSLTPLNDEGDIIIRPREGETTGIPRMPSGTIITASYDENTASVCAYLVNAGETVDVEFYNLTTNEYYSFEIPGSGLSVMPISGNSGHWTVSFTLLSGTIYDGTFLI